MFEEKLNVDRFMKQHNLQCFSLSSLKTEQIIKTALPVLEGQNRLLFKTKKPTELVKDRRLVTRFRHLDPITSTVLPCFIAIQKKYYYLLSSIP